MKLLCSLLLVAGITGWAPVSGGAATCAPPAGASRPLAIRSMQCCDCVESLNAQTRCDTYNCPECPAQRQARSTG